MRAALRLPTAKRPFPARPHPLAPRQPAARRTCASAAPPASALRAALDAAAVRAALDAAAVLAALNACGRRGRWSAALPLLARLEAAGAATDAAYLAALAACRKSGRHAEARSLLARMPRPDVRAYNEVLHALSVAKEPGHAAVADVRREMAARAVEPDAVSYAHLLHACGAEGLYDEAAALLREARALLGEGKLVAGHYLAACHACLRDRRWAEAAAIARETPRALVRAEPRLARALLAACAEAGDHALAADVLALMGLSAGAAEHASRLLACRRGCDVGAAREAWAARDAAGVEPDEVCFALMIGTLFDAAGAGQTLDADDAGVAEALALAARAAAELPAPAAAAVLAAALGAAIDGACVPAARACLELMHDADIDVGAQFKILDVAAEARAWADIAAEAAVARRRFSTQPTIAAHAWAALDRALETSRRAADDAAGPGAADALRELRALREVLVLASIGAGVCAGVGSGGDTAAGAGLEVAAARRRAARRYSRTVSLAAAETPLDVVYEDECLLAVHKPAGVASQPRHRFESASMVNRAVAHLGRHPYPLHLLDGPTSGLLLFGKTLAAARAIERQFVERSAEKVYLAVLLGAPETDAFECALPIARRADALSTVSGGAALGGPARAALTSFAVVSRGAGAVACVVRPASGRLHQIRVHAAALGHPVAGDAQYGAAAQPGRLLLHALSLTVAHPARGGRVRFTALPPQDFLRGTAALGVDAAWDLPGPDDAR